MDGQHKIEDMENAHAGILCRVRQRQARMTDDDMRVVTGRELIKAAFVAIESLGMPEVLAHEELGPFEAICAAHNLAHVFVDEEWTQSAVVLRIDSELESMRERLSAEAKGAVREHVQPAIDALRAGLRTGVSAVQVEVLTDIAEMLLVARQLFPQETRVWTWKACEVVRSSGKYLAGLDGLGWFKMGQCTPELPAFVLWATVTCEAARAAGTQETL